MVFHEMRYFLQVVAEKLMKTPKHDSVRELQVVAKSMIFHGFPRNEEVSVTFRWKVDENAETW